MTKPKFLVLAVFLSAGLASFSYAQDATGPLVTGDLSIYYSFDSIGAQLIDESGNNLGNGTNIGKVVGDVTLADGIRDGAALFAPDAGSKNFIDLDGPNFPAGLIPTSGFSVAAWVNVSQTGGSHGIFEPQSGEGSFSAHIEIKNSGQARFTLRGNQQSEGIISRSEGSVPFDEWFHYAATYDKNANLGALYIDGEQLFESPADDPIDTADNWGLGARIGATTDDGRQFTGLMDEFYLFSRAISEGEVNQLFELFPPIPFTLDGGGETYLENFDSMGIDGRMPRGWSGVTEGGSGRRIDGLGLTDGFLTVPSNANDGVLGVLNLGGNADSFGPAPDGFIPTWTAELAGPKPADPQFGRDDVIADNATDRALGIGRENNDDPGELNFEIEISDNTMRAFVVDWDLEIWGGDPDGSFRSPEGPGMAVDVTVGATSYATMTANLLPGDSFDSIEDGNSDHNATLINGNVHSVRGMTTGIKEVSDADGAVGNMVQVNFNANWNDAVGGADGWFSAIDNVRLRALAPGDADANGIVDVADLLQLLGGQKFNQGVDGVTWEQGDFNADDQFNTGDLLAMLSFLSGTFPSDPYASEAGGASDAAADIIVNSETGEVTVDLAGHTVSAVIIESASEIFNGEQPAWDTTSQFPSTLPGELGNVLFTSTASGTDELGAVISAEFLGRDKEFYLQDLDLNILIASEGGALTKGNVIVVPEPSTWMLLGLGSLLLVGWRQGAKRRSPGMS